MSLLLTFALILSFIPITTYASENKEADVSDDEASIYLSAFEKTSFQAEKLKKYEKDLSNGEIKNASTEYIESLILRAASSSDNVDGIYEDLESYGTYLINPTDSNTLITPMSSADSDVTINTPSIYYNAYNNTWTVSCGGYWKNNNWSEITALPGNVGGTDGFGVYYTSITQPYKSSVVNVSASLSNADYSRSVSTTNRADGDGALGFGFRIQDYTYLIDPISVAYVGYRWSGLCNYDTYFGSYGGVATGYYSHTYNSAKIQSVSFDSSKKVSVSFTNASYGWTGYGNDKRFGVQ